MAFAKAERKRRSVAWLNKSSRRPAAKYLCWRTKISEQVLVGGVAVGFRTSFPHATSGTRIFTGAGVCRGGVAEDKRLSDPRNPFLFYR